MAMAVTCDTEPETDYVDLPSGARVNLLNLNTGALRTQEDAHCLMVILQERIIDIEYQLECYALNRWPNGRTITPMDCPDVLWRVRAKKALGWAKLHKMEAQQRLQHIASAENRRTNEARQTARERLFVDCARAILDAETFNRIWGLVDTMEGRAPKDNF